MNCKIGIPILFLTLLTGCATNGGGAGGILVDTKGKDSAQYESDNRECQQYAESQSVAGDAAAGALFGLLMGAAVDHQYKGQYAGAGALGGLLGGATGGVKNKDEIYRNCMRGRDYNVLN